MIFGGALADLATMASSSSQDYIQTFHPKPGDISHGTLNLEPQNFPEPQILNPKLAHGTGQADLSWALPPEETPGTWMHRRGRLSGFRV